MIVPSTTSNFLVSVENSGARSRTLSDPTLSVVI